MSKESEFNLKKSSEIYDMFKAVDKDDFDTLKPPIEYIEQLHNIIKSYQLAFDTVIAKNRNVQY